MNCERARGRRERLWRVQDGRCFWCNREMIWGANRADGRHDFPEAATIDHLDEKTLKTKVRIPSELVGLDQESRTVLACYACNAQRSSRTNRALNTPWEHGLTVAGQT